MKNIGPFGGLSYSLNHEKKHISFRSLVLFQLFLEYMRLRFCLKSWW